VDVVDVENVVLLPETRVRELWGEVERLVRRESVMATNSDAVPPFTPREVSSSARGFDRHLVPAVN
jgi:hypothetical protein